MDLFISHSLSPYNYLYYVVILLISGAFLIPGELSQHLYFGWSGSFYLHVSSAHTVFISVMNISCLPRRIISNLCDILASETYFKYVHMFLSKISTGSNGLLPFWTNLMEYVVTVGFHSTYICHGFTSFLNTMFIASYLLGWKMFFSF